MKILIASLIALSISTAGVAFAQEEGGETDGETRVEYKKKTTYDFEDDVVEGELVKPDGDFIGARIKSKHSSLIKIREDFIPEMLKSVNDL